MGWLLYILRCEDGSLYTGVTVDLEKRLAKHNAGKGSKAVRGRLPVRVVYRENHKSRGTALSREAEIKSWPRAKKLGLIKKKP